MFSYMTVKMLENVLKQVEPVELQGVALLQQCHTQPFLPSAVDPAQLVEATVELIAYTRTCDAAVHRLKNLRPVPVTDVIIEEYSI